MIGSQAAQQLSSRLLAPLYCLRHLAPSTLLLAVTLASLPDACAQGIVAIKMNSYGLESSYTPAAQYRASNIGTFSIHAAAQGGGQGQYLHSPGNQPANVNTLFPAKIVVGDDPEEDFYLIPTPLPKGANYLTSNKNFNAVGQPIVKINTTEASRQVTTPADNAKNLPAFTTSAKAFSQITFRQPLANVYEVTSAGSYVEVKDFIQYKGNGVIPVRRAPEDTKAAALALDPLSFSDLEAGDHLAGVVGFMKDDFAAQVTDPLARGLMTTEVGSDILGPSLGPLGGSFQDNLPLIFRLTVTATAAGAPTINFQFNPAFTFYNPDDPNEIISPGNILSFVTSRFNAALTPNLNPGDNFTLSDDVALIGYTAIAPQDLETMNVSYSQATSVRLPEPSSWCLLALAGLSVVATRRRKTKNCRQATDD